MYVTEFCEGGSLWECLSEMPGNRMDELMTIEMGVRIAKGIQILHNHKITHRDLKPENILLQKKLLKN
jgi:serine/threonine protein kinase